MFGFLKNKLKEWVGKAKEKIAGAEEPIAESSDLKKSEPTSKKPKKIKKIKEKKADKLIKKDIEEEIKPATIEEVKEAEQEIKETQEIAEKIQENKETPEQAIEELEKIEEKREQEIEEKIMPLQKKSFFQRLKSVISYKITGEEFEEIFNDLEMLLLENNVALEVVEHLKKKLSEKLIGKEIKKENLEQEIKKELKNSLNEILIDPDDPLDAIKFKKEKPFVILFFGINGTGKTTSIAKLAYLLKNKGFSVVLAAGDTFRAASIEQISEHAEKLKIPVIKQNYQSDPAAVGFDAIKYAKSHHIDVVLIDTAGRMHTKSNLLEEMKKITRVTNPDLKVFVAESIAGNDAIEQAKTFHEMIEIDGSILSKADIDEKGGTIISVSHATSKPIFYLGTGQNYQDLKLFNKEEFIENLGL